MTAQRFGFEHDPRFAPLLRAYGVRPDTCWVGVDDERLDARFGRFRLVTSLENVAEVSVSGPYRWYRAIGPRLSLSDRGATFGTSASGGVCVTFHEPVGALFGRERLRHPALTVTVADPDALAAAIEARLPGRPVEE